MGVQAEQRAELRLALVCYGGVSLAVYMHGVTKELQSLIRAARAFDDEAPERLTVKKHAIGTETAYFAALTELAEKRKRLSVSIDIIGGTSAGGINGIALSKGLALGASQEPLKNVWIKEGDIRALLRAPAFWLPGQALIAAGSQLFRLFSATTPLRGEVMSTLILKALTDMDKAKSREGSLVPLGGALELYVPTTDLGGFEVLVPSGAGGASNHDRQNAQVFEFSTKMDRSDTFEQFGPSYTADLAFAARASASFPGAFAPISQESFKADTGKNDLKFNKDVFYYQHPALADDARRPNVAFVDGGVLDNAPFDVVIAAISRRRADSEVHRRLVYIEPDPSHALYANPVDTVAPPRRWLSDLLAVSKVKGNHPFLRELLDLRDLNGRIDEVSAITKRQNAYVVNVISIIRAEMTGFQYLAPDAPPISFGYQTATELMATTTRGGIQDLSDKIHIWTKDALFPSFSTYQRLKFDAAIRLLAHQLAARFGFSKASAQANFINAAIAAWVRSQTFWLSEPDKTEGALPGDELGAKLQRIDVPYRDRRLMFILAGLNELYSVTDEAGDPRVDRTSLNTLKGKAWNLLEKLRQDQREAVDELSHATVEFLKLPPLPVDEPDRRKDPLLADPATFAADWDAEFGALFTEYSDALYGRIRDDGDNLWNAFVENTTLWNDNDKQALLSRYLGFPLWDGMIFPTVSLTRVPQLTPIGVRQFSPLTATKLKPLQEKPKRAWPRFWKKTEPGPPTKLKGIPVSHFAGFFSEESRENDYLWGRLDAAESILRLLGEFDETIEDSTADVRIPHLADALQGVLNSEKGSDGLRRVGPLMQDLQEQVKVLAAEEGAATASQRPESQLSPVLAAAD
jgi:patatin-related protein